MIGAVAVVAATSLFPCQVEVSIEAPGYETTIQAVLNVYSHLSGTTFTTGPNGIHFKVLPALPAVKGVDTLGMWSPTTATIELLPAKRLPVAARQRIVYHELLHSAWFEHNDEVDSVMYPQMNPQHTVSELSPRDAARIAAAGCKDYAGGAQ